MKTGCERTDCRYYSTYTETCDFTLINSRARQCPAKNCTEYIKRENIRTWQKFVQRKATDPGDRFIIAGCGHEVYSGERTYADAEGKRLCPDCVEDEFRKLTVDQKARALGYELAKAVE